MKIIAKEFREQAKEIFNYINKESPQNAEKFTNELVEEINKIERTPTDYPPVRNFPNTTNRYRYKIFMKSFKIVYKVLKHVLIFAGLLHVSQGLGAYKNLRKRKYN